MFTQANSLCSVRKYMYVHMYEDTTTYLDLCLTTSTTKYAPIRNVVGCVYGMYQSRNVTKYI